MVKENIIPKTEKVQELKEEYKVPSFEEFMKGYEESGEIVDSYENEFESEIFQGPQYGPGKKNFTSFYKNIKSKLGKITCKISYFSDNFDPNKNYAGMIIYAVDGQFQWLNDAGKAKGWKGRSFYIAIQCTDD